MRICLLISFFLFAFQSFSVETSEIVSKAKVYVDSNSTHTLIDFQKLPSRILSKNTLFSIGFNINSTIWTTFNLKNNSNESKVIWLCIHNNRIDTLQLFIDGKRELIGDRTQKSGPYLMVPAFRIELQPNEEKTAIIRMKKAISFFDFKYSITPEHTLDNDSNTSIFIIAFFSGLTTLFLVLAFIFFLISKERLYIYYKIYALLSMMYVFIAAGFAKFIFLPSYTSFSEALIFVSNCWFLSLALFISKFLNLKVNQPKNYIRIQILVWSNIAIMTIIVLELTTEYYSFLKTTYLIRYIIFFLTIVQLIYSSYHHLKINKLLATLVLISFIPHFLWVISFILQAFGIIKLGIHTNWLIIIVFFDILFFLLMLTKQYLDNYRKNDILQRAIIENQTQTIRSIENAQIRERKQIANIIHDHFGSKLTHVLHLFELENHELAEKNIRDLTKEMRNVSHQILPKSLENGAFSAALENQINQFNEGLTNAKIDVQSFDFPENIDEKLAVTLFLISLEIISNSLQHGEATEVSIELYGYSDMFVIQFSDNGKGYNTSTQAIGFGINTIENRIKNLGGTFEISSVLGEGTYVQLSIPK